MVLCVVVLCEVVVVATIGPDGKWHHLPGGKYNDSGACAAVLQLPGVTACSAADLLLTWEAKDVPCGVAEFHRVKGAGLLPLPRPGGAEMTASAGGREIK